MGVGCYVAAQTSFLDQLPKDTPMPGRWSKRKRIGLIQPFIYRRMAELIDKGLGMMFG